MTYDEGIKKLLRDLVAEEFIIKSQLVSEEGFPINQIGVPDDNGELIIGAMTSGIVSTLISASEQMGMGSTVDDISFKTTNGHVFILNISNSTLLIVFTVSVALYSLINRDTTLPVSDQYVMIDNLDVYDEYIASQYLTTYELNEIVESVESDDSVLLEALISYQYENITPEDIIDSMNEEELENLFTN